MYGDQQPTGHIIDVFKQHGTSVLHRQVERRGDRLFMRIRKYSVLDLLGI